MWNLHPWRYKKKKQLNMVVSCRWPCLSRGIWTRWSESPEVIPSLRHSGIKGIFKELSLSRVWKSGWWSCSTPQQWSSSRRPWLCCVLEMHEEADWDPHHGSLVPHSLLDIFSMSLFFLSTLVLQTVPNTQTQHENPITHLKRWL